MRSRSVVPLFALMASMSALWGGTIYNQPVDPSGSWASQNDPSFYGNFATTYDNFTLLSDTLIDSVAWAGTYIGLASPGPLQSFTLTFWSDAGGPSTSLLSQTINGTANEAFAGTDAAGDPYYTYSADLPTAFPASANTTYWLSIVANMDYLAADSTAQQWAWMFGTGGDAISYQDYFGTRYQDPQDLAFSLAATPEPGSLLPLLAALGLFAVRVNRKSCR